MLIFAQRDMMTPSTTQHETGEMNMTFGEMNMTFEANGKAWRTDAETLALMVEYRDAGNTEMVAAVFEIGKSFGRIVAA